MSVSLVTGGAGFIGSHVADELLKAGHTVVVADDLSGGFRENIPAAAHFKHGSIVDQNFVEQLFREYRFDYVFHLAAYAAENLSHFIKRFNYQNNLIGSVNLINQAILHKVSRFVFTSSIAVYGSKQLPAHESMRPEPEDPYGIAKFAVELELEASHRMFGLPYIIFRPHNVYGERQNIGDRYRNVVGIFMNQILQGGEMPIFGDGTQRRAFSYIGDVAPLIASSIGKQEAYQQIVNIGADTTYTVTELAHRIAEVFGVEPRIAHLASRKEAHEVYSDHAKARQIFGNREETSLTEGLKRMAEWVRSHGARTSRPFDSIEVTLNLPDSWRNQ